MQYAGFWWRALALIIDNILLGIVFTIIGLFFPAPVPEMVTMPDGSMVTGPAFSGAVALQSLVQIVIMWLYFALTESSEWQATIGKKLLKIRVTDEEGNRISFARATGRFFAKIISGLILCIGYIMAAFTQRKQGLHDIIAKTLVLRG